ncbi:hypothetical protein [Acinetobacter vivianii]|uniref:hypothetical protein n=1 Tax=Acinetobacter vivianii TaxID=1776742 RepID=UPI002DBE9463|nr:hypothetical protein [Acinetobacter vivianii]MEB6481002.1 hypothetical protein [Acinetobacter vivianii]MEB6659286.1 hypothetical protein [Acinetobacter vivianii]MEB6668570.1 hypothetical protein [Acinetobacter vivianii]
MMAPLDHPYINLDQHDRILVFVIRVAHSSIRISPLFAIAIGGKDAACSDAVAGKYRHRNRGFLVTFDPSKVTNASTSDISMSPDFAAVPSTK